MNVATWQSISTLSSSYIHSTCLRTKTVIEDMTSPAVKGAVPSAHYAQFNKKGWFITYVSKCSSHSVPLLNICNDFLHRLSQNNHICHYGLENHSGC